MFALLAWWKEVKRRKAEKRDRAFRQRMESMARRNAAALNDVQSAGTPWPPPVSRTYTNEEIAQRNAEAARRRAAALEDYRRRERFSGLPTSNDTLSTYIPTAIALSGSSSSGSDSCGSSSSSSDSGSSCGGGGD